MRAEIIENEHRRFFDLLKERVEGGVCLRSVRGAEVVKEIWHGEEQGGEASADDLIGDCRGQMRLATAGRAMQDKPPIRLDRIFPRCL